MDQVLFVIIVLVILYMFKDKWLKYMPDIVKKNVLVSGLVFGLLLCYFMKNNIEGFGPDCDPADEARANDEGGTCSSDCDCKTGLLCTNRICTRETLPMGRTLGDQEIQQHCCPRDPNNIPNSEQHDNCLSKMNHIRDMVALVELCPGYSQYGGSLGNAMNRKKNP